MHDLEARYHQWDQLPYTIHMDLLTVIWRVQDHMNRLEVDMIDLHQVPEDLVHQDWEYQGQGERAHLGNFFSWNQIQII